MSVQGCVPHLELIVKLVFQLLDHGVEPINYVQRAIKIQDPCFLGPWTHLKQSVLVHYRFVGEQRQKLRVPLIHRHEIRVLSHQVQYVGVAFPILLVDCL